MRQRFGLVGIIAIMGIGGCGLSACMQSTYEDNATLTQQVTSVKLDSDAGAVTIEGQPGAAQVSLHRSINYRGSATPSGTTYRVDNGILLLNGCGQACSVNYTVTVPAGISVSGRTDSGAIDLSGVSGIDVSTDSGEINLEDIAAGTVNVHTDSGAIQGHGLSTDSIQARTTNGAIDLDVAKQQNITAQTDNGEITLTVPKDQYQVSAQTDSGDKTIDVANDPTAQHHLDLRTSNGAITVHAN